MLKLVWWRFREGNASGTVGTSLLFSGSVPFPGSERPVPGRVAVSRPLLAELGVGARFFAGVTEGWCVGQAWRGRVRSPAVRWRTVERVARGA